MAELKSIKKGDKVMLRMFTGAFVEAKEVEMADAKKIGFTNKKGVKMVFDRKTGKQISPEPKSEKFANFIEVYDAKVEAEELDKKKKAAEKSSQKRTENAKAAKEAAKASKKASKKAAKPVEDDDEYEEVEDDADDYSEEDESEEDED